MTDINALLKSVAPGAEPPSTEVVDGDLARGRAALVAAHRRGRVRRAAVGTASLVVGAAVAVLLVPPAPGGHPAPAGAGHAGGGTHAAGAGVGGGGAGGGGRAGGGGGHPRIQ